MAPINTGAASQARQKGVRHSVAFGGGSKRRTNVTIRVAAIDGAKGMHLRPAIH
jgi:hypothetical protein